MERPNIRRHKVEQCSVPTGDSEGSFDANEKKKDRRHGIRQFLQQSRTQSNAIRLFLILLGFIGIFKIGKNVRRRAVSLSDFPLIQTPLVIPRVPGETIMKEASYQSRPQSVGFYFKNSDSRSYIGVERLNMDEPHMLHTKIQVSKRAQKAQNDLVNSKDYLNRMRDQLEEGDCKAQHDWQLTSYPSCNTVHEHDLGLVTEKKVRILSHGYWRDVWRIEDGAQQHQVLKTIRYEHDFEDRNYDRHRRDALAMERLTGSMNIIDIYAFCGNSGVFEYAPGGDLEAMIWYSDDKWNSTEKLIVSYQVASGISDVHNIEGNGRPSIAHTDITTSQFVFSDGRYKLNDFNRCRFIAWNEKTNKQCKFHVGNNPGNFRSPEEYKYEMETEKIDVYSMGNVFYSLLTELWPFQDDNSEDAQRRVRNGKRPHISTRFRDSDDPAVKALLMAITMSWRQDPEQRATALEVKEFLQSQLKALGIHSSDQ